MHVKIFNSIDFIFACNLAICLFHFAFKAVALTRSNRATTNQMKKIYAYLCRSMKIDFFTVSRWIFHAYLKFCKLFSSFNPKEPKSIDPQNFRPKISVAQKRCSSRYTHPYLATKTRLHKRKRAGKIGYERSENCEILLEMKRWRWRQKVRNWEQNRREENGRGTTSRTRNKPEEERIWEYQ